MRFTINNYIIVIQSESSSGFKSLRSGGELRKPLANAYSIKAK